MDGLEQLAGGGGAAAALIGALVWLTRVLIPRLQADAAATRAEFVAAMARAQTEFATALRDERERFIGEQRLDRAQLREVVCAVQALTIQVASIAARLGTTIPRSADQVPGGVE